MTIKQIKNQFSEINQVELELTTMCNASCPLCFRNYKGFKWYFRESGRGTVVPLETIKSSILKLNPKEIKLVGTISEPTLYPYFLELVKFIKEQKIIIEICTNGDTHSETDWFNPTLIKVSEGIDKEGASRTFHTTKNIPFFWEKLGELLTEEDSVYFTICGSTQELHEVYRKGTSLKNILNNARRFRNSFKLIHSVPKESKGIDYAQCIQFSYNEKDLNGATFKEMIKDFNVYLTETYLQKDPDTYIKYNKEQFDKLAPIDSKVKEYKEIDAKASMIFHKKLDKDPNPVSCIARNDSSIQLSIDQKVYPCYIFLESLIQETNSSANPELPEWSYNEVHKGKYECCKFCNKKIKEIIKPNHHYIF